jgi:lysozyme
MPSSQPADPGLPVSKMIQGVDVSSFQGEPGSWRSAAGSVKWVGVKITELQPGIDGPVEYINPDAAADWAYVKQQKLGRIAYLFAHPSVDPVQTVTFFQSVMSGLRLLDTDGIMLDLETTDGLEPPAVNSWAVAVMAHLAEAFDRTPILYTYLSFAEAGNTAGLGKYPLWISDPSSQKGKPRVPAPWQSWVIHQYETTGAIDRDVANFATVTAMNKAFGATPSHPTPKPHKGNLGGSLTGGVTAVRWNNGNILIGGLDGESHVLIRRYDSATGKWGIWFNPSKEKAVGPHGLLSWGESYGQLYFTTDSGEVIELATEDAGKTWQ